MEIRRREFLIGLGGLGLGFSVGGLSHLFPLGSPEVGPDWRPGAEEFVPSTCLLCPSHCGILGRVVDGSPVSIDGNPLHPVSRGGLCPKGRAGLQLLYHPSRLKQPLERVGLPGSEEFRPISWDDALSRIADALGSLRREGREREVVWLSGHVDGVLGEVVERFLKALGTPHLLRESYDDGSEEILARSQGIPAAPAFDLERSDLVLSFGASLAESWWCLPQAARARDASPGRRPHWVQIDTRLSRTAAAAGEFVGIKPGTFGTLALAMAYVLLKEGFYDSEWIPHRVEGLDDVTDGEGRTVPGFRTLALRHGRPEDLADRIGLPVEKIVRLAKAFGQARRPVAIWDHAVSWRRGGLADATAIHALNLLKGSLNRPGGVFVQPPMPVQPLERSHPLTAGSAPIDTSDLDAGSWLEAASDGQGPPIEVMFLHQANPAASFPEPARVLEALGRVPLVVSFSPFLDETARHADLVLPDHTYLERWQDAPAPPSVPIPVWGVVRPIVPPLHDTRSTGDLILDLAGRIGGDVGAAFPWSSMEQIVRERGRSLSEAHGGSFFVPDFRREELRELESRGWWIPHGQDPDAFWESVRETGGWFDPSYDDYDRSGASQRPSGRIVLFSEEVRRRIAASAAGLAAGFLPVRENPAKEDDDGFHLQLLPYRVLTLSSGGIATLPWLIENVAVMAGTAWEPWVEVHPETAREHGLAAGSRVRIVSARGSFEARLRDFEGAQPGTVVAPYGFHSRIPGWGDYEAVNPLVAIGNLRDPATGLPDWYSTKVRLEPAQGA